MIKFNAGNADACMALVAPNLIMNLAEVPEPQRVAGPGLSLAFECAGPR